MRRQFWLLSGFGLVLFLSLFFFGRTTPPKTDTSKNQPEEKSTTSFDSDKILAAAKLKLTASQASTLQQLENGVVRGDVKAQQIKVYQQLATFWKDTAKSFFPAAYYTAEAAKLENLEKSLTFAAHLFLDNLRSQNDPELKKWMANNAKDLLQQALKLNPSNDSTKVSIGSCYLFGNISSNPMEGILMIREVAERNPHNMYAHMTLGIGAAMSGQFDKAIDRFKKVVDHQPDNVEAVLNIAEAYEQKGDKSSAIEWYQKCRDLIPNPEIKKEIELRINSLK